MQISPALLMTTRVLFCLFASAVMLILALVACDPAHARAPRHPIKPHPKGSFCAPVIMQGAGMVRICGIPAAARR